MRILHVVESIGQSAGSVSICLQGLARALRSVGTECDLVESVDPMGEAFSRADLVHVHGWHHGAALAAVRAANRSKKTWVLSPLGTLTSGPHDKPSLINRVIRFVTERPLRRTSRFVTAVHDNEVHWLRQAGVSQELRTLPLGIDFDGYELEKEWPQKVSNKNILLLGPLVPACGGPMLLKALAELGQTADGWTVTLAGPDPGNLRPALEAAVRRKGGEARVIFVDPKTLDEQKELLAQATVVADVSLQVSSGVSIMQALAGGVPVVATELAAPLEAGTGLSVCKPRREAVREALRTVMGTDPEELRKRGKLARSRSKPLLDWAVLAPRYLELYEECLGA